MSGWRKLLLRCFGAKLGTGKVESSATIWAPWLLSTGDDCFIDHDVRLYNAFGIEIGSRVIISQNAFLCTASHDYTDPVFRLVGAKIVIGDDAWIAADAYIAPGVRIGNGAVVGARAVVTRDVPPWTVVAGNPARVLKERVLQAGGSSQSLSGKGAAK
jgi:putative colanic acid biosynthesis acetyltransferase WcaF